ncbi:MAG: type II toxin-antitoxin system RelB/DinJ family antitoxin [Campylobacterota bacterium]|nr:type II toxin-antitoxin system RelB/DinJ family antitoxin [Campylobacterota bacterium]
MTTIAQSKKVRTNVYLDANMKNKAQELFKTYGMGLSDAFNMFLSQSVLERGIPFQVKIPNDVTLQTMQDIEDDKNLEDVTLNEFVADMDKIRSA